MPPKKTKKSKKAKGKSKGKRMSQIQNTKVSVRVGGSGAVPAPIVYATYAPPPPTQPTQFIYAEGLPPTPIKQEPQRFTGHGVPDKRKQPVKPQPHSGMSTIDNWIHHAQAHRSVSESSYSTMAPSPTSVYESTDTSKTSRGGGGGGGGSGGGGGGGGGGSAPRTESMGDGYPLSEVMSGAASHHQHVSPSVHAASSAKTRTVKSESMKSEEVKSEPMKSEGVKSAPMK